MRQSEWSPGVAPAVALENSCALSALGLACLESESSTWWSWLGFQNTMVMATSMVPGDDANVEDCRNSLLQGDLGSLTLPPVPLEAAAVLLSCSPLESRA